MVLQSCPALWEPPRFLCPWDFSGKNTGVGCYFLLRRIFPIQVSNPYLLHCRQFLYLLTHWGSHKGILNSVCVKLLAFPKCAIPLYFPVPWTYYPSCLKFHFLFLLHLLNQILLTLKDTTPKLIIISSIFYLIQIEVTSVISNTYPYNNISHAVLK